MILFTQILSWYLTLIALSLIGLPMALTLFKALPDQGYAFSRALGLLFTGYLAWLLTIFGFTHYALSLLLFLIVGIGIAGWVLLPARRSRLEALRNSWRTLLAYEILFLASFLFLAWMRSYDPNPQGTERPMDYALYNAIMRSPTFPPHDPWLSGYAINYYYLREFSVFCRSDESSSVHRTDPGCPDARHNGGHRLLEQKQLASSVHHLRSVGCPNHSLPAEYDPATCFGWPIGIIAIPDWSATTSG